MLTIRLATSADTKTILQFVKELAEFEKLAHEVAATEEQLSRTLFGERRYAEVLIAEYGSEAVGFALYFHNYSTFLGKPGIYLEDLYVTPLQRSKGVGKKLLVHLAQIAIARQCGRLEWSVLDWNQRAIDFYKSVGAKPMDDWTVFRLTGDDLQHFSKQDV